MESYLERIKQLKSEKKMTNERLAERSGIPLGTLSKMLAGMSDSPKLSNIVAICRALDCSVEYIVSGTPENRNNSLLDEEELWLVEHYRLLDGYGKELTRLIIEKEAERNAASRTESGAEKAPATGKPARILRTLPDAPIASPAIAGGRRTLPLYELPVSAGAGMYLEEAGTEQIMVPAGEKTNRADYALRISGNSMEPKYHNGDVLLVEKCDDVKPGEMGIFLLDGNGFFKVYEGDRLISLNPSYSPILLRDYADVRCRGRVIGRLKRK